jgi:carbonic anhydrase
LLDAIALPSLPSGAWGAFVAGVLTVALIASVESLLTAVAVDRMQSGPRSNLDRELVGQGAANVVSGAIGGLPITGVIVRSSANVAAGAKSRASTILHAVWILVFALPFAALAEEIPTAALAGLLIVIGVQLVKFTHIETARRTGDIAVYLVTVLGVVFLNLLEGVLLGLALAVALTVWRVARARIHAERTGDDEWLVAVDGSCSFLSLPKLHHADLRAPRGPGDARGVGRLHRPRGTRRDRALASPARGDRRHGARPGGRRRRTAQCAERTTVARLRHRRQAPR